MSRPPLLERINARLARKPAAKSFTQPPFWSLPSWLATGGPWSGADREAIENDFLGYVEGAYKSNGIVYALIAARQAIFSQVRFGWREFKNLRPGDLFPSGDLALLETPWPSATTADLLSRMEPVASLAGNYYATVCDDNNKLGSSATGPGRRIVHMRPDWTTIVIKSPTDNPWDLRAKVGGYLYEPNGGSGDILNPSDDAVLLVPSEVCHYAPYPDPAMRFRGMSWLTPVLREIQSDKAATKHKDSFFTNGARLSTVVRFDKEVSPDSYDAFVARFNAAHKGSDNAYSTLFLGGGADVSIVGGDMQQAGMKELVAAGETRLAAAAGVHPTIAGFSEGLSGSSLNAGNFGAARRLVADKTLRHMWGVAASSLQTLLPLPPNSPRAQLWYETRDVPFLREDTKDAAEIQSSQAQTLRTLIEAGYEPKSVTAAVVNEDWQLLKHTGKTSVQLQEPGAEPGGEPKPDAGNDGNPPAA